ncbi:peptidoglycan-binding protein [bacterium]|nr:peptidoglycan-binding protein [bacterium]MCI0605712.1 peptidoglycan-binding protein [bacterium]
MVRGVGSGGPAPVPQDSTPVGKTESTKTESAQNQQVESKETKSGAASNAASRIAETAMTGSLLAAQLQTQLTPEKPTTIAGSAVVKKPDLAEGPGVRPEVKETQKQLNEWRARNGLEPLKEDGIFGPKTKAAVQQFQEANGLKKDGIVGGNTRDRLALENNENFQKLNPQTQDQVRTLMNGSQKDPVSRQALLTIATDENFGKLSRADQDTALQDIKGTASNTAEKTMQGLNNDQLLKLAESPGGKEQLAALKMALEQGPVTPAKQKELDRINSATFTPAGGLKLQGSAADQATYLHMTRREMLTSPAFAKTMNEINADKAHPVTVNVGRDMPGVRLDVDRGGGKQDVDLADLEKLPVSPTAQNPHAITQGEVLIHAMREARQRALGEKLHGPAHEAAIKAENEYRKDIGQTSFRKTTPGEDETFVDNELGDISIVIHFDGAPDEELKFDKQQKIQR